MTADRLVIGGFAVFVAGVGVRFGIAWALMVAGAAMVLAGAALQRQQQERER
jgi:hypothetical protein